MVARATPGIDFDTFPDSDGEPMAETNANVLQMLDLLWSLQVLCMLQGRARSTIVGSNQFVYYNPNNGRDNISPDVYVVFDRPPPAPPSWKTWVEGKFPDVVFEITSPTTHAQDLSMRPKGKRRLYAELGAREYYIFDPQQETDPPFLGFTAREGRMEPLSLLPSGGIMSPLLGTELRPVTLPPMDLHPAGTWLRVIDPTTGERIPLPPDEHRDLQMARERLGEEAEARQTAEHARAEAEERAARAEAELQALRALLARGQGTETASDQE